MNYQIIVLKLMILKSLKILYQNRVNSLLFKSMTKKYLENINGMNI